VSFEEEIKAVIYVLKKLADHRIPKITDGTTNFKTKDGTTNFKTKDGTTNFKTKQVAQARYSPLKANQIDNTFLSQRTSGDFGNKAVYLVPRREEEKTTIALWCKWKLDNDICSFWFFLGIWQSPTRFIGYRYEMPEIGCNHNYYHVQPCRNLGNRDQEIPGALQISDRYPTWPLAAESALELLLCLIVSLYGMKGLIDLVANVNSGANIRPNSALNLALKNMLSKLKK